MVTLTAIIQCYISRLATEIHQVKTATIQREKHKRYAYVALDGSSIRKRLPAAAQSGWRWQEIEYERVTGYISPKHVNWPRYQSLRHQVSMMLTARHLLKLGQGNLPSTDLFIRVLKDQLLAHHASKGRVYRQLCKRAWRYLNRLNKRLTERPERFSEVAQWQVQQSANREVS